ncbi:uncharacterized protein LOC134841506 isoform X2 [Symsagittifera roscoffensis]|uniref:uncharacterized protein LOC134841506 isoform X2 n=1 Tax=Symsagittifera roscoffensis TaxID=84072 RepID=UPI00307BC8CE
MGACSSSEAINGMTSPRLISEKEAVSKRDQIPFFKLIVVGESGSGKTTIINAICGKSLTSSVKATKTPLTSNFEYNLAKDSMKIGISVTEVPPATPVKTKQFYYQDLDGAILVVDLSDSSSLRLSGTWKRDILTKATQSDVKTSIKHTSSSQHSQKLRKKGKSDGKSVNKKSSRGDDIINDVMNILTSEDEGSSELGSDIEQKVSGVEKHSDFPILLIGTKTDLIPADKSDSAIDNLKNCSLKGGFTDSVAVSRKDESAVQTFTITMNSFFHRLVQKRAAKLLKNNSKATNPGFPSVVKQKPQNEGEKIYENSSEISHSSSALNLTSSTLNFSSPESARLENETDFDLLLSSRTPRNRPVSAQHQFFLTGSTDLDVFLLQTEPMMARVAEMRIRLEKQKVHLCETCYESGVVKSQGIPVLTCITALRDQTAATKPIELRSRGSSGVFELLISSSAPPKYRQVVNGVINSQLLKVCGDIEREFPMISHAFINAEEKLNKESKNAWNLAIMGVKNSEEIQDMQSAIDKNQTMLFSSQELAREILSEVRDLNRNVKLLFSTDTDTIR